jgi:RNA polymerase sigma-70 factor (ECF subfamily)
MINASSRRSDTQLALLAQKGDVFAFEEIYDRHCSGVARSLASFAGPDQDLLDDLTQDVFLRVIKSLESYAPTHPFSHWLYTIALNVGRNHSRTQSRVIPVNPSEFDNIQYTPDHTADWSEEIMAQTLTRLVACLPFQMREVVSLRVGSDMSYGEIAEVLGIPEGTARSRMHNAIKVLRDRSGITRGMRRKENER